MSLSLTQVSARDANSDICIIMEMHFPGMRTEDPLPSAGEGLLIRAFARQDRESRFFAPSPRSARQNASQPALKREDGCRQIEAWISFFKWLCASRSAQLRWAAHWAVNDRGQFGRAAIVDRGRFQIYRRRLNETRRARDAWQAARDHNFR
jgi:hypothetical protein